MSDTTQQNWIRLDNLATIIEPIENALATVALATQALSDLFYVTSDFGVDAALQAIEREAKKLENQCRATLAIARNTEIYVRIALRMADDV